MLKERVKGIIGLLQSNQATLDEVVDKIHLLYNPEDLEFEERKKEFIESVRPFIEVYGKDMCNDFISYWIAPAKKRGKGTVMFWETKPSWHLKMRLSTWYKNNKKFSIVNMLNKTSK